MAFIHSSLDSFNLTVFRHSKEMQEVINESTNKYSDVFVRNLAQKHMEDKQVKLVFFLAESIDRRSVILLITS